jgi:predicted nucleic acid-binding protein
METTYPKDCRENNIEEDTNALSADILRDPPDAEEIRTWEESFNLSVVPKPTVRGNIYILGELIQNTRNLEIAEASLFVLKRAYLAGWIRFDGDLKNWLLENVRKGFLNENKEIRTLARNTNNRIIEEKS